MLGFTVMVIIIIRMASTAGFALLIIHQSSIQSYRVIHDGYISSSSSSSSPSTFHKLTSTKIVSNTDLLITSRHSTTQYPSFHTRFHFCDTDFSSPFLAEPQTSTLCPTTLATAPSKEASTPTTTALTGETQSFPITLHQSVQIL